MEIIVIIEKKYHTSNFGDYRSESSLEFIERDQHGNIIQNNSKMVKLVETKVYNKI